DLQVVLEVGEVEHRLARRALAPQALGHRLLLLRALVLDLGRHEFSEPAHARIPSPRPSPKGEGERSSAERNSAITDCALSAARAGLSASSCTIRLPITTASANPATRFAVAPSRMPKPTPTGTLVCLRMRWIAASTSA